MVGTGPYINDGAAISKSLIFKNFESSQAFNIFKPGAHLVS